MSDIRFNQWLHNSGTGGVSQVDGGHVGIGTTNPEIAVHSGNNKILNVGIVTASTYYGSGANLTGISGGSTGLDLDDNVKIRLGNDQDMHLYHDGNHSYIDDAGTGNLRLRSGTLEISNLAGNKTSAIFSSGGGQTLNFNNNTKFVTTNTGAVVTGILTATASMSVNHSTKPFLSLHTGTALRADFAATTGITSIRSYSNSPFTINIGGSGETEALRITAAGDVGIGTAIPVVASGYGNLSLAGSTGGQLEFKRVSTDTRHYIWGNTDLNIGGGYYNGASSSIIFRVNGATERFRIGNGGGHKITCDETYYAVNLAECNSDNLAFNINKTRQGQTKGIAFGAIGNGGQRTGIQCYDTSDNSANTLLLNPHGGKVAINVSGEPSAQFEVANDSTTGQLHVKHGWASRRFFSLPIINNETRWYKIVNYAAGNMLVGSLQIYTTRQGGFNQTKGYNEWKVSYVGYSNSIYGTGAENSSFYAGTGASVDIVTGSSPVNVYIKVPGSIYAGYVYFIFEGIINNWQLDDSSYLTSAP